MQKLFRALPSMDLCLTTLEQEAKFKDIPRSMLRMAIEKFLNILRDNIKNAKENDAGKLHLQALLPRLSVYVYEETRPRFRRTINATGVVIHTNMGRSVLPEVAARAAYEATAYYNNLELDLTTGERGSRQNLVEELLCHITGAEAAIVVNNNAAAVLLALDALCKGGEVIVSRGQLVEIGGSFRIPEVMERSGALLREVGTTNRTHKHDYQNAINEHTVALLRVHTSNFRIIGFHKEVPVAELVELGKAYNLPVIEDLGIGSLIDMRAYGLGGEPTVQAILKAGAHVVTCSGDKVFGGPQAGIIVGQKEYIERMRLNPLYRALRCDKCTMAALEATLRIYTDLEKALHEIPTLRMITMPLPEIEQKAISMCNLFTKEFAHLATFQLCKGVSRVGGGSFPERNLPTSLVCVLPRHFSAIQLKQRLLKQDIPLMGRLMECFGVDNFCLDPRTVHENEIHLVYNALGQALA